MLLKFLFWRNNAKTAVQAADRKKYQTCQLIALKQLCRAGYIDKK